MKYNYKLCGFDILIFLFVMVNVTKCGNESWTRPSDCTSSVLDLEMQQVECRGLEKEGFLRTSPDGDRSPAPGREQVLSSPCFSVHKWNRTKCDLVEENPTSILFKMSPPLCSSNMS